MPESFDVLPDEADLWIYAADRPLSSEIADVLGDALDGLMGEWASHGRRVLGRWHMVSDRVLVVSAWVPDGTISGCGIDKSLRVLDAQARAHAFEWVDGLSIVYRLSNGSLDVCSRESFRKLAAEGAVSTATPVIDLSIRSLGAIRSHGLERPAGETWHGRVFDLAPAHTGQPAERPATSPSA